ncbi:MAG: hypothetical protein OYH77_05295 [Pseudomonadota bacterium]|nr:hypothetical protein [Pseudomonadota bacterium]
MIMKKTFGYYPYPLEAKEGNISIETLPGLKEKTDQVYCQGLLIENDWASTSSYIRAGVFHLPHTHVIKCTEKISEEQLDFYVWILSFFVGMRLTTDDYGFVGSATLKPNGFTDFVFTGQPYSAVITLTQEFLERYDEKNKQVVMKRVRAILHALYLGRRKNQLQYEQFIYFYIAIDACYRLVKDRERVKYPKSITRINHNQRVSWLCDRLCMTPPNWHEDISEERNAIFHEAMYAGAPLGYKVTENLDLPREMAQFVCRILVAILIGKERAKDNHYVQSPVNDHHVYGLSLK